MTRAEAERKLMKLYPDAVSALSWRVIATKQFALAEKYREALQSLRLKYLERGKRLRVAEHLSKEGK